MFPATIEVTDVLPPPNHEDLHVQIMAVAYLLLFLLGTCGNVAVLTTILHVFRGRAASLDNTMVYIIVLSCVDFGVCLSLPFTVIDQILGFWMFGSVLCKLHAVFENFGKILSSLILIAMSFDRYAGVCRPRNKQLRQRKVAFYILLGLTLYVLVTLCPLLWSFGSREIILFEKETGINKLTRMKIDKCTMRDISTFAFTAFTLYQFFFCYCVPLVLVSFFYSRLLQTLRSHARAFKSSHIPLMRISLYTLAVACFYFLCWTPFWAATVYAVYLEQQEHEDTEINAWFVYCMYFIHALPFTNSAINWILYGALNSQLQHRSAAGEGGGRSLRLRRTSGAGYTAASAIDLTGSGEIRNGGGPGEVFVSTTKNGLLATSSFGKRYEETEAETEAGEGDREALVNIRLLSSHVPALL